MGRINSKTDRVYPMDYMFKKVEELTNLLEGEVVTTKEKVDAHDSLLADNAKKTSFFTTPENYGAKADGTDDSVAFQNAINSFNGKSGKLILDGTKTYSLANTVSIPYNVSIDGNYCSIKPIAGGTFKNNFMFYVNAKTTDNKVIQPWGGDKVVSIENIALYNSSLLVNIKGFYTKSKTNFKNLTFDSFYKGILKEGSLDIDYCDNLTFSLIYFINCLGTEPLIEISNNGDGLLVDSCHVAGDGNYNFLSVTFCNGGKIMRCINGDIKINSSIGISIENYHCEHGKITIQSSQVSLKNIYHWYHKTYQPIPLTITQVATDKPTMPCVIENYYIIHAQDRGGMPKDYVEADYIDAYFKLANVKITNFFRRSTMIQNQSLGMETGVKITLDGTTIHTGWETNNQVYSKESYVVNDKVFSPIDEVLFPNNYVAYSPVLVNHAKFDESLTTYYYQAIFYYGYSDRSVGRWGGGEVSLNVNNQSLVPLLSFAYRNESQLSKVRLYRGTAAGQYTNYVDIPIGNGLSIYDYGFFVSTGERWKTRATGGTDSYNSAYVKTRLESENMIVYGTAIPTVGTWKLGDRVINTNRVSGQPRAWVCTTAGTPGTWLSEGNY